MRRFRLRKLRYADIVATLALFVALGGTAAAAGGLFTGDDVVDGSLTGIDVANRSLGDEDLANGSVHSQEVGDRSLTGVDIRNGSLEAADLGSRDRESLRGDRGPRGHRGAQGPPGELGLQGERGPAGPPGEGLATAPAGGDLTGSYPDPEIRADAVDSQAIAADAIGASELSSSSVWGSEVADDSLDAADVADTNSLTGAEIMESALGLGGDLGGSVANAQLGTDSVGAAELGTNAAGPDEIATNAVGADELADDAFADSDVGSLPSSPVDGQVAYFKASASDGVLWTLRYNAGSTSPHKWEYVGGTPLYAEVTASQTRASTSYGDLATVGPSVTAPLAGDYTVEIGATIGGSSSTGAGAFMSYQVGAAPAADADAIYREGPAATTLGQSAGARVRRKTGLASTTLTAKYRTSNGETVTFGNRWIQVLPVRVG